MHYTCNLKGNIDNAGRRGTNVTEWDKPNFMTFICFTFDWRAYDDLIISSQSKDNSLRDLNVTKQSG